MKRRFLILGLGVTVGIGSLFSPITQARAETNQQLQNQKENVIEKKDDVQSSIDSKQGEINQIKNQQEAVQTEIKRLDLAVADTSNKLREKEAQIKETKIEIERLNAEIEVLKERIEKRDELLRERMRSIQENGGVVSYLDVLLGAQSFSDFINRVSAVSSFVQADRDILTVHQQDKQLLEETELAVKEQLTQLETQLVELEEMKQKLKGQIAEKNKIMAELKEDEEHLHEELGELEDEKALLASQERAIKQAIEAWNQKQRELEEERKRQAEAAKASGSAVNTTAATPTITSGTWMRPAAGRLSSGYGSRWNKLHAGIDIANSGANVPIVAAADGIVFRSYYSSSYGNVVFITHHIDGQIYTTVYAHMQNRTVSEGQSISKGTKLGYMGNTGRSYGQHLHFELHKGMWNISKSNSVDPRPYIY